MGTGEQISVRGYVPTIPGSNPRLQATLLLNGKEIVRQTVSPGNFDLRADCQPLASRNHIELRFSAFQSLPAPDLRKVSARLDFIGFENSQAAASVAPAQSVPDIVLSGSAISLGDKWYPIENFDGQTFRWVANNAHFTIPPSSPRRLALEVEPGPGVASKPFTLKISDSSGRQLHAFSIAGRRKIQVDLPPASYRLHLDGGGKPTPNDPRILNFRVFSIAAQ